MQEKYNAEADQKIPRTTNSIYATTEVYMFLGSIVFRKKLYIEIREQLENIIYHGQCFLYIC